ncbi:UNVERIFIED_CONTAM: hypothetical protein RMT77_007623 [Armadillidium vulgare]
MKYDWVLDSSVSGETISSKRETFRKYRANLQLMVEWYNLIKESTSDVEFSLIDKEMLEIEEEVRKGSEDLTWDSEGIWEYIENLRDKVCNLEERVSKAQNNVTKLNEVISTWASKLVFQRMDGKKDTLLNLNNKEEKLQKIYDDIKKDGESVKALIEENRQLLRVEENSPHWDRYLLTFDYQLASGLSDTVLCSLAYLIDNCESRPNQFPLLEAKLVLENSELRLQPSSEELKTLASDLISDIFHIAILVPRLAVCHERTSYQAELEKDEEIQLLRQTLFDRFDSVSQQISECKEVFLQYQFLWCDNREQTLQAFVTSGQDGKHPQLAEFKEKIDSFENLYSKLEEVEEQRVFDQWLKVDICPFKHDLLVKCKKWSYIFKKFLIDKVTDSITNLDDFIRETESGVNQEVEEGDYETLVSVMGHLVAVRDRLRATDAMFEPLKQTIALVQQYEEDLPEAMHLKLQELPERWETLKKQCDLARQNVAPLKANEITESERRPQNLITNKPHTGKNLKNILSSDMNVTFPIINSKKFTVEFYGLKMKWIIFKNRLFYLRWHVQISNALEAVEKNYGCLSNCGITFS